MFDAMQVIHYFHVFFQKRQGLDEWLKVFDENVGAFDTHSVSAEPEVLGDGR